MDIGCLSKKYRVTRLEKGQLPKIYELMAANSLYYQYCPPFVTMDSIEADMKALPEGMDSENKYYVGFWKEDTLAAVLDLILGYPQKDMAWIGFFMVNAKLQSRGLGSQMIEEILACLEQEGYGTVGLAYAKGNGQSEHFWKKNGFRAVGAEKDMGAYTAVIMEYGQLPSFDNHDSRIRYYELALERSVDAVPQYSLPEGYHFEFYKDGDRDAWIAIEKSAKEIANEDQGILVWRKYFGAYEHMLDERMIFVVDEKGEKVATASAYFDVIHGDPSGDGWLHWVAVRRDHQGRGLSKPLISQALNTLKALGYTRAKIPTQTTSWVACKVYLDFGFMPTPENAVKSRMGWCILKRLTRHPLLKDFDVAGKAEVLLSLDLKDPAHKPSLEEIQDFIGIPLFSAFYSYMCDTYKPVCSVEFSRDSWFPGWNMKFRKAGKGLCVLYPYQQFFKVLVVVGNKERAAAEALLPSLSKEMQEIYHAAKEGNGQRWLMIDVEAEDALYEDVLKLIRIRRISK